MKRYLTVIGVVLSLIFVLCSCEQSVKIEDSPEKTNDDNTQLLEQRVQNLEEYIYDLETRIVAMEQSLSAVHSTLDDEYLEVPKEDEAVPLQLDVLEMVENIFSLNCKEILTEYPNAELEYPEDGYSSNVLIEGNFAGLTGFYEVCMWDDGTVWTILFDPDDESLADESIVDGITASLGEYIEYDSEWDYYVWETDTLEIEYWIGERTYIDWIGGDLDVNEIDENEDAVETRAEVTDYDEFKHIVDICIQYVPDCMIDLEYTEYDTSYSINLDNVAIGILGTKIEAWDAVALTDPDKEDALLHHEQISIALIMACDSDVTYEEAKNIFDEAKEEGDAKISTGKYFFEGVAEGMYAGAVDIMWLD